MFKKTSVRAQEYLAWTWITCTIVSFIAQLLLCVIFWQFATPNSGVIVNRNTSGLIKSTSDYAEIEVEDFDDHAELQSRIWNQFMRVPKVDELNISFERMHATPDIVRVAVNLSNLSSNRPSEDSNRPGEE